ncbi:L,D-transpeptidase [Microlunatus ginsengisoli]|uniref:Ig-like domain-containing protein n=1 Tax=Microlunatus ginsengisoli TaxID=363863 RepID=A0ABP7AUH3_9ACTN
MSVKKSPLTMAGALATVALLALTAACGTAPAATTPGTNQSAGSSGDSTTSGPSSSPTPEAQPVVMTPSIADGASKVKVDTLVSVKASDGTLKSVKVTYKGTDGKGQKTSGSVDGGLSADKASWTATERLEPNATYTITSVGTAASDGTATTTKSKFKTANLSLQQQTFPTLYPLKNSKVGVGMPVVLTFDVPIKNKASIEKNLHVTTVPKQTGSWHWISSTEVRYRPAKYWKPGTKVSVKADVNGVSAGNGIYGQNSTSTNFTVGRSMVIKVNLATDVAHVYKNGKKVRTIYVSGGKAGWRTRSGTKLIMSHEYNKKMTNEMIGAAEDYSLNVAYAMRITNSGEFLHSAPWNAGYFGRTNASHGCTGMSTANAAWLMNNTLIGDPVVFTGSDRYMSIDNGWGDWNESFSKYKTGSALG